MWRVGLQKVVKEVRFVVKPGPEHHGTWFFIRNQLDELRQLNPNTFFSVCEMNDNYTDTQSSGCFIYGDLNDTQHEVKSDNMRPEDWEEEFKKAVSVGTTLKRIKPESNTDRDLPVDIVEARKYRKYMDDGF